MKIEGFGGGMGDGGMVPPAGAGDMFKDLFEQMKQDDAVVRALMNDQRLMKLADYDSTHGYTRMKVTQEEVQAKFVELKGLVKNGEFTLKALEDDVYNRWGINESTRDESLRKEEGDPEAKSTPIAGFTPDGLIKSVGSKVAKIGKKSKKNH